MKYLTCLKLAIVSIAVLALFGCGEEDEAKKLGFSSVTEMKEIQAKGWHTMQRYDEDRAKASGFASVADMKAAEATKKEQEAKVAAAKQAKEAAQKQAAARGIPSNWKKWESKDSFTDKVTRTYTVLSNESRLHDFSVACSKKGDLNFYIEYPTPSTAIPGGQGEVNVRIDSDPPYTERWYVNYGGGVTRVENPTAFFEKIQNRSKLAIEIFAATRSTYDISGIESVVLDMQSLCKFN